MYDRDELERIAGERKRWEEETLKRALERGSAKGGSASGGGERQDGEFRTSSSQIGRLYTPLDIADTDYLRDIGYPGEYPYTRGIQSTMYRGRLWSIRQYAGYGTAEESNQRFRFLLSQGQPGL